MKRNEPSGDERWCALRKHRVPPLDQLDNAPARSLSSKVLGGRMNDGAFAKLLDYLNRVPSIADSIGTGCSNDGQWWVKFVIDINDGLAWRVVQEFGHVVNYLSLDERLPAVFKPVSPPPYMNGGPQEFLSWVIESEDPGFSPDKLAEWLEGRLPRPVENRVEWEDEED